MARPRKMKPRSRSGRIKKAHRTPDRIEPTPELMRHKRAVDGKEPEDPLSHLKVLNPEDDEPSGFHPGLIEALDKFRRHKRACGFSCGSLVAKIDDTPRQNPDDLMAETDDLLRRGRYEAAAGALLQDTRRGYDAVHSFAGHWGGPWKGCEVSLLAGAASLADHYHIKIGENHTASRRSA